MGLEGIQQPLFDFEQGACDYGCNRCTQVCPTGALRPLDLATKRATRIGVAHFFKQHCVVCSDGEACQACIEHCPTRAVTGTAFGGSDSPLLLPRVDENLCIGCGICEQVCPVRPGAIRIEGFSVHQAVETRRLTAA